MENTKTECEEPITEWLHTYTLQFSSDPYVRGKMVQDIMRHISSTIKAREREVIEDIKQMILRNSNEEYTNTAKSYLLASTDKLMLGIEEYSKGLQ